MTSTERRQAIAQLLHQAQGPLSASALAARMGVSRQIVVGDVALLRAGGLQILATPRGYVLDRPSGTRLVVACRHDAGRLREELYTVADCGCGVLDVVVEHPVYGQLSGQLQVFSRADADAFCRALAAGGAEPLSRLTGGVHLHTLSCPSEEHGRRVLHALRQAGFLYGGCGEEGDPPPAMG